MGRTTIATRSPTTAVRAPGHAESCTGGTGRNCPSVLERGQLCRVGPVTRRDRADVSMQSYDHSQVTLLYTAAGG